MDIKCSKPAKKPGVKASTLIGKVVKYKGNGTELYLAGQEPTKSGVVLTDLRTGVVYRIGCEYEGCEEVPGAFVREDC